jgi:hypothetical protein
MKRFSLIVTAATLLATSSALADLPSKLACIADDVYFVWYRDGLAPGLAAASISPSDPNQKIAGYRATEPNTRMRFADGKLYISSDSRSEHYYADLSDGLWRFTVGDYTLLFSDDYKDLIAIGSNRHNTEILSLKCVPGL